MCERGSSRAACSKCAVAASQRPRPSSSQPSALSSSALPGRQGHRDAVLDERAGHVRQHVASSRRATPDASPARFGASARARSAAWRAASAPAGVGVTPSTGWPAPATAAPRPRRRSSRAPRPAHTRQSPRRSLGRVQRAHPLRGLLAPQECVVGGKAPRRPVASSRLALSPSATSERLRHLAGDLGLHLEHVGHRRVERLLPLRSAARAPGPTSTSSGLTRTRLAPPGAFSHRTVAVSR